MILTEKNVQVSGTIEFTSKFNMEIDASAYGMVLEHLIQQYQSPHEAALRENTSNAWDAHLEAGQTRPVEVTLPSQLTPYLRVQDFGVGMNYDELRSYAQFGASSKRETNELTGGFGLGSKSALAICSQFTVVSVKDGLKNTVIIGRNESNALEIGFLAENTPTDEENGTTVMIPTTDSYKFEYAIKRGLFDGWAPGTININGRAPKVSLHNPEHYAPLNDKGWLRTTNQIDDYEPIRGLRALVGVANLPVEVRELDVNLSHGMQRYLEKAVIKLENGSVELQRSREGLLYDKPTIAVLKEKINNLTDAAFEDFQARIEAASTLREALTIQLEASPYDFKAPFTYKGETLYLDNLPYKDNRHFFTATSSYTYDNRLSYGEVYFNNTGVLRNHLRSLLNRKTAVLVTHTPPSKNEFGGISYPEAKRAAKSFVNAVDRVAHGSVEVTFFARGADKLPELVVGYFTEVITYSEYMVRVTAERKLRAEENRKNSTRSPQASRESVRILSRNPGNNESRMYYDEYLLSDVPSDPEKTYIVLQSGQDDTTDKVIKELTQVRSRAASAMTIRAIETLLPANKYVFLLANKSWKVSEYGQYFGKIVSLEDALQEEVSKISMASKDVQVAVDRSVFGGVFHKVDTAAIENDETREWVEKIQDDSALIAWNKFKEDRQRALYIVKRFPEITLPVFKDYSDLEASDEYPMLRMVQTGYGSNVNWDAIVDYINMVDNCCADEDSVVK